MFLSSKLFRNSLFLFLVHCCLIIFFYRIYRLPVFEIYGGIHQISFPSSSSSSSTSYSSSSSTSTLSTFCRTNITCVSGKVDTIYPEEKKEIVLSFSLPQRSFIGITSTSSYFIFVYFILKFFSSSFFLGEIFFVLIDNRLINLVFSNTDTALSSTIFNYIYEHFIKFILLFMGHFFLICFNFFK